MSVDWQVNLLYLYMPWRSYFSLHTSHAVRLLETSASSEWQKAVIDAYVLRKTLRVGLRLEVLVWGHAMDAGVCVLSSLYYHGLKFSRTQSALVYFESCVGLLW